MEKPLHSHRFAPMENKSDYSGAWQELKRMRDTWYFLFASLPLVVFGGFVFSVKVLGSTTPATVLAFTWTVLVGLSGIRYRTWPCPRCGKAYGGVRPFMPGMCVYCKLPKWTQNDRTKRQEPEP